MVPKKKNYKEDKELNSKIVELHIRQRKFFKETARILGISREKAKRHLEAADYEIRHYSRKKPLDPNFAKRIFHFYYGSGLTQEQTAKKLNCGRKKIAGYMKAFGMQARNSSEYPSQERQWIHKRIVYWHERGLRPSSVAKIEGVPYSTAYSILERNRALGKFKTGNGKRIETLHHKGIVFMAMKNRERYRKFANERILRRISDGVKTKRIDQGISEFQSLIELETQEVRT